MGRRVLGLAVALCLVGAFAMPAYAAFPGQNGKIAFISKRDDPSPSTCDTYPNPSCNYEIYTINPDGTGQSRVTNNPPPSYESNPVWSPDGRKIAFIDTTSYWDSYITTINPDGTNMTHLYGGPGVPEEQFQMHSIAWDPDSSKFVFEEDHWGGCSECGQVYSAGTVNADGSNPTFYTDGAVSSFDWSPDGDKIAFSAGGNIQTMNPDGTNHTVVYSSNLGAGSPSWSPDGSKIAFSMVTSDFFVAEIFVVNSDGTGRRQLTNDPSGHFSTSPVWSPDGKRIAFVSNRTGPNEVFTMNADGTGVAKVTNNGTDQGPSGAVLTSPDWQPIPINGYPRPKGATPFQTYLTVAFKPCASPNEQHGSPLAVLSCSPPQQASDFLTVGTLDANGQAAKAVGSLRYDVKPGNASTPADEADVKMNISIKDVRMKTDLSDYAGELQITSSRRITDKLSTPAADGTTQAATAQDTPFSVTVPCAPTTTDTTIGSTCAISTTADAVVPGQVAEGARSNWELGQVKVYDGGADSDADTTADNTLFMDEGVFVP